MGIQRTKGSWIGTAVAAAAALGYEGAALGQIGACCRGDGVCIATDAPGCTAITGEFLGAGVVCAPGICLGACCTANKGCAENNQDACTAVPGVFQGAGSTCELNCPSVLATAFTYQGQLKEGGLPLSDAIDLECSLWTAAIGGTQVGVTQSLPGVEVLNGLFSVGLDFGAAVFTGNSRWLEVSVRSPHDPTDIAPFTTLAPRQPITAAPYATTALSALSALSVPGIDGHSLDAADGNPTNAVFVDNSGNVGIGTTAPKRLLHVSGGSDITQGGAGGFLLLGELTGFNLLLDQDEIQAMGNGGFASLSLNALGGHVGIGTVTPAANLHVFAGSAAGVHANAFSNLVVEESGTNYISFLTPDTSESGILFANEVNNQNGGIMFNTFGNPDGLQFRTGGNWPRMTLSGAGDVGIGTITPARKLHVSNGSSGALPQGTVDLVVEDDAACYVNILAPDASERGVSFGSPAGANHGGIYYTNAGGLSLRTNGDLRRMMIAANGDVGIGVTDSPNGKLHVQAAGRVAKFDRFGSDGEIVVFARDDGVIGNITNVGGTVSYNAFTGSHYGWSAANIAAGALVSMTGENRRFGERGDAEVVYGIQETAQPNDPRCLGAKLGLMESSRTPGPENPILVGAVGNGDLCLVDRGGGNIEPGDALISSDVPGCAMKDDPTRFPIGYVVARAGERVHWDAVPGSNGSPKRKNISVLFESFVRYSATDQLNRQVGEQRQEIDELKQRLAKLEAMLLHSSR